MAWAVDIHRFPHAVWLVLLAGIARGLMTLGGSWAAAGPEQPVALVIGNGAYVDAPLNNPPNDVQLMAHTLPTSPQAQQLQQEDNLNGILAT